MKDNLTAKEIFQKVVNFESCPRTLKWEMGYLSLTIPRWYKEGLPRKDNSKPIPQTMMIAAEAHALPSHGLGTFRDRERNDVSIYFNLDEGLMGVPVSFWYNPLFEKIIFYEDDNYIEYRDSFGIRKREYKDLSSMPLWLEFPVKTRSDWEKIKEEKLQFNGIIDRFYPKINMDNYIKEAKNRTAPLVLNDEPVGFFGSLRHLMGEEKLLMTYYDDPGLIKDMAEHLCNLWLSIEEELTGKLDFDLLYFWEDMSYKQGSLISPSMIREFMLPYYKRIIDFAKSKKIKTVLMDSDGYVDELIRVFGEVGVNMMYPFERQAGNDLIGYRKKYPELIMTGGFDKNTLFKGKDYIDKELEIITELIKKGGFIPHADHWLPHNASWENFKYYREKLNKIIDSTKVL